MKNKTKLSTALLIGSAVIGSTNCEAQVEKDSLDLSKDSKKENQLEKKFPIIKRDSIELEKRLKELSETEYKGELRGGAMCYMPMYVNDRPYTCPVCKKVTMTNAFDALAIDSIRVVFQKIKQLGYDVYLNESEFCEHCRKRKKKNPAFIFKIRFSENAKYHVVKSNIEDDFLILFEFLKGKDKYDAGMPGEIPLNLEIDVLKKMTGLGKNVFQHKFKHYGIGNMNREEYIELLKELKYTDEEIQKKIKEEDERK